MQDEIVRLLERYADLEDQRSVRLLERDELMERVIPAEVREALRSIEEEYGALLAELEDELSMLAEEIRRAVLEHGASVRSGRLLALHVPGRVTWDTRSLERYGQAHPEVLAFRRQGEPYIVIRRL